MLFRWRSCLSCPFPGLTEEKGLPRLQGHVAQGVKVTVYKHWFTKEHKGKRSFGTCLHQTVQPWESILAWRDLYWHKTRTWNSTAEPYSWTAPSTPSILTPVVCGHLVSGFITTYFSPSNMTGTCPWTWEQRLHWLHSALSECSAA